MLFIYSYWNFVIFSLQIKIYTLIYTNRRITLFTTYNFNQDLINYDCIKKLVIIISERLREECVCLYFRGSVACDAPN